MLSRNTAYEGTKVTDDETPDAIGRLVPATDHCVPHTSFDRVVGDASLAVGHHHHHHRGASLADSEIYVGGRPAAWSVSDALLEPWSDPGVAERIEAAERLVGFDSAFLEESPDPVVLLEAGDEAAEILVATTGVGMAVGWCGVPTTPDRAGAELVAGKG